VQVRGECDGMKDVLQQPRRWHVGVVQNGEGEALVSTKRVQAPLLAFVVKRG
jgi:hypothetical protein